MQDKPFILLAPNKFKGNLTAGIPVVNNQTSPMVLLRTRPLFLLSLPVFFVFHGYTENYDHISAKDACLLTLLYIAGILLITCIFWPLYRDSGKTSLLAFALMSFHFFFGNIQDMLRNYFEGSFFSKYSFILLTSLILLLALAIWLKKRKRPLSRIILYLNLLLFLFFIIDAAILTNKILYPKKKYTQNNKSSIFNGCDTCKKPDIYLIIPDAYTGNTTLKEFFNFDNFAFENELSNRGFHIVSNSSSNYNSTPYSVASMLNMDYLTLNTGNTESRNLHYCYRMIRDNSCWQFLSASNYAFYNYSIFDFEGQPAISEDNFLPTGTKLITAQTFTSRFWNDIGFLFLARQLGIRSMEKKHFYSHLNNTKNSIRLTRNCAAIQSSSPKFVYTHLMMPHYPYYYDSKGHELSFDSVASPAAITKKNDIEYLQYCNRVILKLVDDITNSSSSPPIIILASDHGSRGILHKDRERIFKNFIAVLLPARNYSRFYPTLSNVNLFRTVFNTQFGQQLPLLKDSSIYLLR